MNYRQEIDGLRAVAVLPVILYHAGFEMFSGGFVGVDVFFVISGYLITTIILSELQQGNFSLISFYERRARRILPALFLVMLVCIPFAWFWLLPGDMKSFSKSLVAVSVFSSNILFFYESGYFDTSAEFKPLIHTWSLAVEEQYYLAFPLFLMIFWRLGKRWLLILLATMFVGSLAVSQWGLFTKPAAAFFLLPARGWELLIGAFAAYYLSDTNHKEFSKGISEICGWSGIALILCAIFTFDKFTPFPGIYALVPTVGTFLVILFATQSTTVGKIIGNRAFVGMGLISYSAYLWHQPLFAFARHKEFTNQSHFVFSALSVLAIFLAYLSWRFIENPFRNIAKVDRVRFLFAICACLVLFFSIGIVGSKTQGYLDLMLRYKFPDSESDRYKMVTSATNYDVYSSMINKECQLWVKNTNDLNITAFNNCSLQHGKALVIVGDSHAMNLYNIVSKSEKYPFILGVSQGGCRPHNYQSKCHYEDFKKFVLKNLSGISQIIYHQSGSYFIEDKLGRVDSQFAFEGGFSSFNVKNILISLEYLEKIQQMSNIPITWVGPFLEFRRLPNSVIGNKKNDFVNPESIRLFNKLNEKMLEVVGSSRVITYRHYADMFFEPKASFIDGCFVFRDADHFSQCGELMISKRSRLD